MKHVDNIYIYTVSTYFEMMPNLHRIGSDSNNTSMILELHNYLPKF